VSVEDPVDISMSAQQISDHPYWRWMDVNVHRKRANNQRPEHVTSKVATAEMRDISTTRSWIIMKRRGGYDLSSDSAYVHRPSLDDEMVLLGKEAIVGSACLKTNCFIFSPPLDGGRCH
jgi:hypothetical protein